jgi:hypothetical protein
MEYDKEDIALKLHLQFLAKKQLRLCLGNTGILLPCGLVKNRNKEKMLKP